MRSGRGWHVSCVVQGCRSPIPGVRDLILTSLRGRLIASLLTMLALLVGVGLGSYRIQSGIQRDVRALRARRGLDRMALARGGVGLEAAGHWTPGGVFRAEDVELIPAPGRTKLRGALQTVDVAASRASVFALEVRVDDATEFEPAGRLSDLTVGQRVELTCEHGPEGWRARKIETTGVKVGDKVKGAVLGLDGPEDALRVRLEALTVDLGDVTGESDGALAHLETGVRLLNALAECRAVARELAVARPLGSSVLGQPATQRLQAAVVAYHHELDHARTVLSLPSSEVPLGALIRWVGRLDDLDPELRRLVARLLELHEEDAPSVATFVENDFEPWLVDELWPVANAYLSEGAEELRDQLRAVVARGAETTRLALGASLLAVLVFGVLGVVIWRSVHRPVRELERAAARLGAGDLETRVTATGPAEFVRLAEAFNHMAADLRHTTLSMNENETLLREVHHRVKNNMQVVSSLLALQGADCSDPAVARLLVECQGRIRSMALVHEQLTIGDGAAEVDARAYFERLALGLARSLAPAGEIELTVNVGDVRLDFDCAMSCGLIIHELVANAFQHAFGAGRGGRVSVSLEKSNDGMCQLDVVDDGRGWTPGVEPGSEAARQGHLGMNLVQTLVRQLGGEIDVRGARGTHVTVVFPSRPDWTTGGRAA